VQGNLNIIQSLIDVRVKNQHQPWILLGDFNLPEVSYTMPFIFTRRRDATYDLFFNFFEDNLLNQLVHDPTRGNAVLDLIWSSKDTMMDRIKVTAPIASSDHNTVLATIMRGGYVTENESCYVTRRHFDLNYAAHILSNTDWLTVFSCKNSVDELLESFMSVINIAIPFERLTSAGYIKQRAKLPKIIRKLIYKKRKCWKKLRESSVNDPFNAAKREKYKSSCKAVKQAIHRHRCTELTNLADCKNTKKFFQYVNKRVKARSSIHHLTSSNGTVESDIEKAILLNNTFGNNFTQGTCNNSSCESVTSNNNRFRINITYEDVLRVLSHVSPGASGPDGLNGDVIRSIAPLIAKPLFTIFQQSIFNGIFPLTWKRARIAPIYKGKGARDDPN
jgi:hypothetical protein